MRKNRTIWRNAVLIFTVSVSILLAGCAKEPDKPVETAPVETSASQTGGAESQSAPNPMEEVDSALAFEKIGVHMVLPEEAAEPSYFIINGEVADVKFSVGEVAYTYRASDTAEDFAGIFERFTDNVITETCKSGENGTEVLIKTTESGGRLAAWDWGSTKYTLYTASQVTDDDIRALAVNLAELGENEK